MHCDRAAMVYLTKRDVQRNQTQFYVLDMQPTLFGEWELVREWGRIGQAGQVHRTLYAEQECAAAAFERELRRRKRRGYA
jgi:predicted DNA-binding WGR domain protein